LWLPALHITWSLTRLVAVVGGFRSDRQLSFVTCLLHSFRPATLAVTITTAATALPPATIATSSGIFRSFALLLLSVTLSARIFAALIGAAAFLRPTLAAATAIAVAIALGLFALALALL
jgi:hypothetical protein